VSHPHREERKARYERRMRWLKGWEGLGFVSLRILDGGQVRVTAGSRAVDYSPGSGKARIILPAGDPMVYQHVGAERLAAMLKIEPPMGGRL
jgi:hypothetical protein